MLSKVKKQKENVEFPANGPYKFAKNVSQASSILNTSKYSSLEPKIEPGVQHAEKRVALLSKTAVNVNTQSAKASSSTKKNNKLESQQKSIVMKTGKISNYVKYCQKTD